MKYTLFLLTILLSACATKKPNVVQVQTRPMALRPTKGLENIRYAETIKSYPVARYIDPNNPRVMHERHPVYRVESTAKWNLHANGPLSVSNGPAAKLVDSASRPAPVRDELFMELNRQKAVTQTMIEGSYAIYQQVQSLTNQLGLARETSGKIEKLQDDIKDTQQRLDALSEELRKKEEADSANVEEAN